MKLSLSFLLLPQAIAFTVPNGGTPCDATVLKSTKSNHLEETVASTPSEAESTQRRMFLNSIAMAATTAATATTQLAPPALAIAGSGDGLLPELPPDAVRSYLQYRIQLQIAVDYYIFELQSLVSDIDQWGEVGQLFRVNNNKGQGSPSRIERDYVNPMRVLWLSMPPDVGEEMREAQFRFERAMNQIGKATAGYRKDLPVEIPASAIVASKAGWEEGRVALNDFLSQLNAATGLNELKPIPAAGPNQRDEYGRSYRKYNDLVKKTKLCQNRGGPALSQGWGLLMVSGYMQDSCGIPDLDLYFYQ